MARIKLTVVVALTSLALAGPAFADDPFEISKRLCIETGKIDTSCITFTLENKLLNGDLTIGMFIDEIGYTIERIREINGWGEEVTPETVVPVGATFAFG